MKSILKQYYPNDIDVIQKELVDNHWIVSHTDTHYKFLIRGTKGALMLTFLKSNLKKVKVDLYVYDIDCGINLKIKVARLNKGYNYTLIKMKVAAIQRLLNSIKINL